jgi:prevent-host-death family protein
MEIPSRQLRNQTRRVLERVQAGETLTITVSGRPVATISPVPSRPRWMDRDEFRRRFAERQADSGMQRDLIDLAPDTTDDLPAV